MVTTYTLLTNNVDTRDPIGSKNREIFSFDTCCLYATYLRRVSVESISADILCRISARNILSVFAMRVFHESRGAKGLKGGFYSTIRTANQGWILSLSGLQIRGEYCPWR